MKKIFRYVIFSGLICIFVGLAGWMAARAIIVSKTESKALAFTKAALQNSAATDDQKIIAIATEVFKNFEHADPARINLLRLRPFITNHRLPEFLRLPDGVIETNINKGYCDNAGRMLAFILKQEGYDSVQWDMIFPTRSHSALLVSLFDGRKVFVDSYYGYAAVDESKKLISPEQARERIKAGNNFKDVFISLGENSEPDFYQNFQDVSMAAQGDPLILESELPALNGKLLILGEIDGNDIDVKDQGTNKGLTPYWHYIGHKYNRGWVRVLKVSESVKITMTLVDAPEDGILNASPAPAIEGKTLTWDLKPGESLIFKDADAKLSLKRLNSYIGVDQIIISSGD